MKILSIDASTKSTGIAIFEEEKLIHYECIQANDFNLFSRIWKMVEKIHSLYYKYLPTNVILEDVLPQDVKHNNSVYKALIYLQAAIVLDLYKNKVQIDFYNASHWRSLVGIKTGRGIKRQTLKKASVELIKQKYGITVNDDISDAICLGIAYINQHKSAF